MTVQATKNDERRHDPRIGLLKELADPIRLRVIDRLSNEGPATVTRLADELGLPLPQLSNHLRRLRDAHLVTAQRDGRQVVYSLADPGLELLTVMLDSITGRVLADEPQPAAGVPSRTCYGHLGGPVGVALYRALRDRQALRAQPDGMVVLGPAAAEILPALGIDGDTAEVPATRQRFAFECLDATQRAPHLAGALGDALARALTQRGWIARRSGDPGGREYALTPAGEAGLARVLGTPPNGGSHRADPLPWPP